MRSLASTHKAQWSGMMWPGFGTSSVCTSVDAETTTRCVPKVVHTSIPGSAGPWLQARARETVGAKAASSIAHSNHRLSLRSWAEVQVMDGSEKVEKSMLVHVAIA
jgi:hypothetical protein